MEFFFYITLRSKDSKHISKLITKKIKIKLMKLLLDIVIKQ